jgi:hypothetical protein
MTDRTPLIVLAAALAVGAGIGTATGQEYGRQLQARIAGVEAAPAPAATADRTPERLRKYAERTGTAYTARGAEAFDAPGAADAPQVRISIAFDEHPQRALAPNLIYNGKVIGIAVGAPQERDGEVIQDFLVLPSALMQTADGAPRTAADAPQLTVQMGDDARTATTLTLDDGTMDALRAAASDAHRR